MENPLSGGLVHIVGIGGIGMSAIAEVMAARGVPVQGSDQKDSANLQRLAELGIKAFAGHEASRLAGVSRVVISTAVQPGNPEVSVARARGIPIYSRADALAALTSGYRTIAVSGSHGKTTTTAMIATILARAGLDPTALVGGVLKAWKSNVRIGRGEWMVVEADESDGTFLRLAAEIGVVTNIDSEHLDYYGTEARLHAAFETFLRQITKRGVAVVGIDHPAVGAIVEKLRRAGEMPPMTRFGVAPEADVRLENVLTNGGSVAFDAIVTAGKLLHVKATGIKLQAPGVHNALNAAAAIGAAAHAGVSLDIIARGLEEFEGVDRRFTKTGNWNGVAIYDDYAHHPAEISAALSAARGAAKGKVIAVMQPHRFSRLKSLFDEFCCCFRDADMVLIAPVYAAGEAPNGFDRDTLVEGIRKSGHGRVFAIDGEDTLVPAVAAMARPGDLVIGLGAGNITEWARALPLRLSEGALLAGAAE